MSETRVAMCFGVVLSVCGVGSMAVTPSLPQTYLYDPKVLLDMRDKLHAGDPDAVTPYQGLLKAVGGLLPASNEKWTMKTGPWSVMNKTVPLPDGVSKHDYFSIGIYNHPCNDLPLKCKPYPGGHLLPPSECNNNTGLPWEPCDGIRNYPGIAEGDAPRAGAMSDAVINLALASFFCSNVSKTTCENWASRAALILRVWFINEATAMEPNLYFGQIDPKTTAPSAGHGGFIEWTHLPNLLDAVALLRFNSPDVWTENDHTSFLKWVADFNKYVNSKEAAGERDMTNNHGTWFDSTWQGVALHANNVQNATVAANEVLHRRIDTQIKPNGEEWIELERANPSGYCQYNLLALVNNANLAHHSDVDIWNYVSVNGSSVRGVLDWLLPYTTGAKKWPYAQNSEAPTWTEMFQIYRMASVAFKNETYEKACCLSLKPQSASQQSVGSPIREWRDAERMASGLAATYKEDVFNLLIPPIYKVTC